MKVKRVGSRVLAVLLSAVAALAMLKGMSVCGTAGAAAAQDRTAAVLAVSGISAPKAPVSRSDAATGSASTPEITTQPASTTAYVGDKATFTVKAKGKGTLSYQWQYRRNESDSWKTSGQSGNKTATLKVSTTAGLHGYQFRCVVTDSIGQTFSNAATLTLSPKITIQPEDIFAAAGTKAKFTVTVTGKSAITYQWQYRTSSSGTWKTSGQSGNKTATLTVSVKAGYDGYQFRCIVTDGNSQQTISETATLLISPKITAQPADAFAGAGDKVKFTVTATGKSTLTYQWQYRTSASGTWKNSGQSGNKTATLTVTVKEGYDGYQFRCIVTDGNSQQTISDTATLMISPKITAQPTDASVTVGTRATFTVEATGEGTLTYQWQYRKDNTREWANSGQNGNKTATLSVATTAGLHGYQFRCIVTDGSGRQLISNVATLALAPGITAQPEDTTAEAGSKAKFTVTATGKATLTYQWQYRKDDTREWTNSGQSGNKTATLSVSTTTSLNGYQFRCIVTDGNSRESYTNAATLTVNPRITRQPVDTSVYSGSTAIITVAATGMGALQYQWQYMSPSMTTWKKSGQSGNKTATLSVAAMDGLQGYRFRCAVTDESGQTVYSKAVKLTVVKKKPGEIILPEVPLR